MAPSLDRPQTVNEFRDRPVSRRERAQKAKTDQIVNHVVGNPLHRDRERRLSVTDPTDAGKVATILQRMNIQTTECRLGGKVERLLIDLHFNCLTVLKAPSFVY